VIAAVLAGAVALFAPCCISVMLPAYFATAFQNRRTLIAMTFLFAAGVATVILPIAVGAHALQPIFTSEHTLLYTAMGVILLGLAGFLFLGGKLQLPMPGRRSGGKSGPLSVYTLGIFSGAASSCCAPVLAGVLALSGAASSFGKAVGLGSAYVFGMVAPLFVISLLWERVDWRSTRLFRPRSFILRVGSLRRSLTGTALMSGLLLAVMGVAMLVIGLTSNAMPSARGWPAEFSAKLQHYAKVLTDALSFIPGWMAAAVLIIIVALLAWRAISQVSPEDDSRGGEPPDPDPLGEADGSPVSSREPEYV